MTKNKLNAQVDKYLIDGCMRCKLGGTPECKVNNWQQELELLRNILLSCVLTEELKWRVPCYTFGGSNIVLLSAFKEYCAVAFFKGSLLKDTRGVLFSPGANSQAVRQFRFTNVQEIETMRTLIKDYIREAIELESAGRKVEFKEKSELKFCEELQNRLDESSELSRAFKALTPGRQRAYNIFFSAPKQSQTRKSRIEKCVPQILEGRGLNDR